MVNTSQKAGSAWAPLRIGIFRMLWLAALVSNIGSWMQTVGAQWLLVQQPHASILVALVQTAETLPYVLFAYIGGVLADIVDRRLLLFVIQGCLSLGANGYGFLLGALGVGAIVGALTLPSVRARLPNNALLLAASLLFALALAALVLVPNVIVILLILIPTGVAWIAVLSRMNAAMQLFLPVWIRARGLSVYQIVLFGSQAAGAVLWGVIAGPAGLVATFLIAAVLMAAGAATIRLWPLFDTRGTDRSLAVYWPEPHLVFEPGPQDGPVLVTTTYTVAEEHEQPFLQEMSWVRRSRLRTGAVQWGLYRDGETAQRYMECFVVLSWEEHLRQHRERQTGADQEHQEQAMALSDPPPETTHLLTAVVPNV